MGGRAVIYGMNFNKQGIPPGIARKFAKRVRVPDGPMARLVGVGQNKAERDAMLIMAQNGHRKLHVRERRTASTVWYGIYEYE